MTEEQRTQLRAAFEIAITEDSERADAIAPSICISLMTLKGASNASRVWAEEAAEIASLSAEGEDDERLGEHYQNGVRILLKVVADEASDLLEV